MSEFNPITTMAVLNLQDDDAIVAGYLAGFSGEPAPGSDKCRGFHHGYSNGLVDSGRATITPEQQAFARDYLGYQPTLQ